MASTTDLYTPQYQFFCSLATLIFSSAYQKDDWNIFAQSLQVKAFLSALIEHTDGKELEFSQMEILFHEHSFLVKMEFPHLSW